MTPPPLREVLATPGLAAEDWLGVGVADPRWPGTVYLLHTLNGAPEMVDAEMDLAPPTEIPPPGATIAPTRAGLVLVAVALALRLGVPREAIGVTAPSWRRNSFGWTLSLAPASIGLRVHFAEPRPEYAPDDRLRIAPGIDTEDPVRALWCAWAAVVAGDTASGGPG